MQGKAASESRRVSHQERQSREGNEVGGYAPRQRKPDRDGDRHSAEEGKRGEKAEASDGEVLEGKRDEIERRQESIVRKKEANDAGKLEITT